MSAHLIKNQFLKYALCLGIIWGFAEGTVFFIVPDVLISLIALFSFKRSLQCMGMVLAGSLLAGILLYFWAAFEPDYITTMVKSVPFVTGSMFTTVQDDYHNYGAIALLMGPISGIPYKIYAVLGSVYIGFLSFFLISIPARLERFVITWAIFAVVGFILRKKRLDNTRRIFAGHGLYWVIIYIFYWSKVTYG